MIQLDETELTTPCKVYVFNKNKPRRPSFFRRQQQSVGPHIEDQNMPKEEKQCFESLRSTNVVFREFMAEFYGTFLLTLCGNAVGASMVFNRSDTIAPLANPLGWGLTVALAIYATGGVTGAHLNPAVTVALATVGKVKWGKVLYYMLAQYLGAFISSAVLYGIYIDSFDMYDGGFRMTAPEMNATAQIFSTFPKAHVSILACFFDQILGTALLLVAILAIGDENNMKIPKHLQPLAVGFCLCCLIMGFGYNCGAALNPARDFGPRLFTAMAGWGVAVFSHRQYNWFWIPIIACHLGAIIGAWSYKFSVELHWPNDECKTHWKLGSVASVSNDTYIPTQTKSGNSVQIEEPSQDRVRQS